MKKYLLAAAALLTLATACNQSDDDLTPAATNRWVVGNTTYTVSAVDTNGQGFTATDAVLKNSIFIVFRDGMPKQSGEITVSDDANSKGTVGIIASDAASQGGYYVRSGKLKVTLHNGKTIMSLPPSPAQYVGMTTRPDAQVALSIEK